MRIVPLTFDLALMVAANMREDDRREIYATRWLDDPEDIANDCHIHRKTGYIACLDDGKPVAAIGAIEIHPHVWSVWMFATDDFPKIALELTKFAFRHLAPAIRKVGGHRAECRSIVGHEAAHRWLRFLGAKEEARLSGYGKNGEDFILFAWRA